MAGPPDPMAVELSVYTDALIIRGTVVTPHRRLVDILAKTKGPFLALDDVTIDEHRSRGQPILAPFAQVRRESILFVLVDNPLPDEPDPAPAHPSVMLVVPPFNVAGRIDALSGDRDYREAVAGLPGGFIRVSDAVYWSEPLGEGRRRTRFVAVNGDRVQAAAPFRDVDPWAGLDQVRLASAADEHSEAAEEA